nr:MAG TPA: hypothetical protein [Caudoviricetes sp.]
MSRNPFHGAAALVMYGGQSATPASADALFDPIVCLVRLDRRRGKTVVVPPADECGHGGAASGDQLLQLGAVDGQDGLAHGGQYLVGQGQQEHGGAGHGTGGDGAGGVGVGDMCVHSQFLSLSCSFASRSEMRWLATFICSSKMGTRRAKLLCSRTSRVSSSSLVSVTAWLRLLAISTPIRVTAPAMIADRMLSIGITPSARPAGFIGPGVHMHPALGPACLDRVAAHAAPGGHQALGVGRHDQRVGVGHLDVRRPAQQVLAGLAAAHGSVVCRRAVSAGDGHRFAEVLPDALQQHHKALVDHDGVGAVTAAEFPHGKAGRQLAGAVCFQAVLFDCHFIILRSHCCCHPAAFPWAG